MTSKAQIKQVKDILASADAYAETSCRECRNELSDVDARCLWTSIRQAIRILEHMENEK